MKELAYINAEDLRVDDLMEVWSEDNGYVMRKVKNIVKYSTHVNILLQGNLTPTQYSPLEMVRIYKQPYRKYFKDKQ